MISPTHYYIPCHAHLVAPLAVVDVLRVLAAPPPLPLQVAVLVRPEEGLAVEAPIGPGLPLELVERPPAIAERVD